MPYIEQFCVFHFGLGNWDRQFLLTGKNHNGFFFDKLEAELHVITNVIQQGNVQLHLKTQLKWNYLLIAYAFYEIRKGHANNIMSLTIIYIAPSGLFGQVKQGISFILS